MEDDTYQAYSPSQVGILMQICPENVVRDADGIPELRSMVDENGRFVYCYTFKDRKLVREILDSWMTEDVVGIFREQHTFLRRVGEKVREHKYGQKVL